MAKDPQLPDALPTHSLTSGSDVSSEASAEDPVKVVKEESADVEIEDEVDKSARLKALLNPLSLVKGEPESAPEEEKIEAPTPAAPTEATATETESGDKPFKRNRKKSRG